jgi:hypothetical protein
MNACILLSVMVKHNSSEQTHVATNKEVWRSVYLHDTTIEIVGTVATSNDRSCKPDKV